MTSVRRGKHESSYTALCEACGVPLEQIDKSPWRTIGPLYRQEQAEHSDQ